MPTYEQMFKTIQILQSLSDLEQEILFFMYDQNQEEFFMLAGRKNLLKVTIFANCEVEIEIDEL